MATTTYAPLTYQGDDVTLDFAITFKYILNADIQVWLRDESGAAPVESLLVLGTHYNLTGSTTSLHPTGVVALPNNVKMLVAPTADQKLIVKRSTPRTQLVDFIQGQSYPANTIELAYDKLTHVAQEMFLELSELLVPGSGYTPVQIIWPVPEANKLIGWNAAADALENKDPADIAAIQADLLTAQQDIDDLENDLAIQTARIDDDQINIGIIGGAQAALTNNDANQDLLIANHESRIQTIEGNFTDLTAISADVADHEDRIVDLETDNSTNKVDIAALQVLTNQHSNDIQQLQTYVKTRTKIGKYAFGNNIAVPDDMPNLTWNGEMARSVDGYIEIFRKTDLETRITKAKLSLLFHEGTWYVERDYTTKIVGDFDGVTFSIVTDGLNNGTLHYTTDEMLGGNYEGMLRFYFTELSINLPDFVNLPL